MEGKCIGLFSHAGNVEKKNPKKGMSRGILKKWKKGGTLRGDKEMRLLL